MLKKGSVILCLVLFLAMTLTVAYAAQAQKEEYIASTVTKEYHLPTCDKAKEIRAAHRKTFSSKEAAEQAGYKPCSLCIPEAK